MSSKRAIRRKSCDGKTRFVSFAEATRSMRSLLRYEGNGGWPLGVYHCSFCGGYHFGHTPLHKIKARQDSRKRA